MISSQQPAADKSVLKLIASYRNPSIGSSMWQLINTLVPYILLWIAMIYLVSFSWWYILPLILLATGFTVRLFIIFHDCGHGAFFRSKTANNILGTILGILTFTPYHRWHHAHLMHHRTSGNLDKRGEGDVWTLTVDEYKSLPRKKRFFYRIYRNPFIMFGLGAPLMFLVSNRFTRKGFSRKERLSVYVTNAGIALMVSGLSWLIGFKTYLMIQIPITYFASVVGVFLFLCTASIPGSKLVSRRKLGLYYRSHTRGFLF
jgi:omega-6 fatty acid desaturase (delta-12 desaturase)